MNAYKSKYGLLVGTDYSEVMSVARKEFNTIRKTTKRNPYVRSKYFKNDKVFLTIFWDHLAQKHRKNAFKRLKFYKAGLDLIRNTTYSPDVLVDSKRQGIVLYRFYGKTKDNAEFCVQIKQDARSGRKDFMSVYDIKLK
jgi:hypothetical protein